MANDRQRVAVITGASSGIGKAAAESLAGQGWRVIAVGRNPERSAAAIADIRAAADGGDADMIVADLALMADVERTASAISALTDRIDVLVNNAGVFEVGMIDGEADNSRFTRQVKINYEAVVAAIREVSGSMGEGGRIITLSSVVAHRASLPGLADYGASKRAIEGYSKGAARDLGPKGITVNVIGVGSINTEMNPITGPAAQWQIDATSIGRFGKPEEIAAVIAFVASPAASFITGAIIPVDGGAGA